MIRVLLADDHPLVRSGLTLLLEATEGMSVVGAAADGAEAVAAAERLLPDVVLMDLSMPTMDGLEATRRITASLPGTKVLVLTSFADPERVRAALDAGAHGYLLKDSEPADLLDAVRAVMDFGSPLHPRAALALADRGAPVGPAEAMTAREREVLRLLGRGMGNRDIAAALGIRPGTVKTHLSSVFLRIGVADRTSAALWALRHLPPDRPGRE